MPHLFFFTVCVCEQETEDDSIFSVSLWKSHASWNQTISFSYHCLPTSTICQRIVQGRNQIANQNLSSIKWGLWMGGIGGVWYFFWPSSVCFDQFRQVALAQIQRLMGFSGSAVWCQRCCVVPAVWCVSVVVWGQCRWQPWGFNGLMGSDQLEQLQPSWALISYEWASRKFMFLPAPPVHNRVLMYVYYWTHVRSLSTLDDVATDTESKLMCLWQCFMIIFTCS